MKRRELVLQNLGGKCIRCGTKKRLHLHHVKYEKDSARWVEGKPDPYNEREKEAYEHPERFQLLCVTCHGDYHKDQRIRHHPRMRRVYIPLMEFEKERLRKTGGKVFRNGKQIFPENS